MLYKVKDLHLQSTLRYYLLFSFGVCLINKVRRSRFGRLARDL